MQTWQQRPLTLPLRAESARDLARSGRSLAEYRTIHVFTCFDDARADWRALSREATISPYQSFEFLSEWFSFFSPPDAATPFLIVARDETGRPNALLPLCIVSMGGIRFAEFLGGREANFNLPLLRPDAHHDEKSLRWLLQEAANRAPAPPDLYYLRNQPRQFETAYNPLVFQSAQPAASSAYSTMLPATVAELTARVSRETRKKLRRKEARLAELGRVVYEHQVAGTRGHALIEALLEQKSTRFQGLGNEERSRLSALLHRLLETQGDFALELHGLSLDGRFVAAYAGIRRGGRFSAMLNSFDMEEAIARCSPGDLLLHALMRNLVERRMTSFDLGAGEARYKKAVCEETVPLYDVILPVSERGAMARPLFLAFLAIKRRAKRSPVILRRYYELKTLLRG